MAGELKYHDLNAIDGWLNVFFIVNIIGIVSDIASCFTTVYAPPTLFFLIFFIALKVLYLLLLYKRSRLFRPLFYVFTGFILVLYLGNLLTSLRDVSYNAHVQALMNVVWLLYIILSTRVRVYLSANGVNSTSSIQSSVEQVSVPENVPEQVPEAPSETPLHANGRSKHRFCKLCGAPIDSISKRCTGCEKQYFNLRPPRLQTVWNVLSICLIITLFAGLLQINFDSQTAETEANRMSSELEKTKTSLEEAQASIELKDKEFTRLNNVIRNQEVSLKTKSQQAEEFQFKAYVLDTQIAFVTTTGSKYHHIDCQYVNGGTFFAYNTELAKSKGYTPCSVCWK